jgi:NADH-quinone oxidoreductase subunit E
MLSAHSLALIDKEVAKYPAEQKQSAVMSALRIAQTELGWLSKDCIEYVANYLEMPPIAVYEVATFYNMYDLAPVGRNKVTLCTNLPCQLQGADQIAEHLQSRLGIGFGETTADGRYTLKEGECMGACGDAPVMMRNNRVMLSWMTPDRIDALVEQLRAGHGMAPGDAGQKEGGR